MIEAEPKPPTFNVPKLVTVYQYYGSAIYFDNKLVKYFPNSALFSFKDLAELLGLTCNINVVRWEDMPMLSNDLHNPPEQLSDLTAHFGRLNATKRNERIAALEAELEQLRDAAFFTGESLAT